MARANSIVSEAIADVREAQAASLDNAKKVLVDLMMPIIQKAQLESLELEDLEVEGKKKDDSEEEETEEEDEKETKKEKKEKAGDEDEESEEESEESHESKKDGEEDAEAEEGGEESAEHAHAEKVDGPTDIDLTPEDLRKDIDGAEHEYTEMAEAEEGEDDGEEHASVDNIDDIDLSGIDIEPDEDEEHDTAEHEASETEEEEEEEHKHKKHGKKEKDGEDELEGEDEDEVVEFSMNEMRQLPPSMRSKINALVAENKTLRASDVEYRQLIHEQAAAVRDISLKNTKIALCYKLAQHHGYALAPMPVQERMYKALDEAKSNKEVMRLYEHYVGYAESVGNFKPQTRRPISEKVEKIDPAKKARELRVKTAKTGLNESRNLKVTKDPSKTVLNESFRDMQRLAGLLNEDEA